MQEIKEKIHNLIEERYEAIKNRLVTEPNPAGVGVWLHDGKLLMEPIVRYGLKILPAAGTPDLGFPVIVFTVGEFQKLSRGEMVDWILSSLERRILENLKA
jgi:hypothetical protein